MQIKAAIKGDLTKILEKKNQAIFKSVNNAVVKSSAELKSEMKKQTSKAGMSKLANTWKANTYNKGSNKQFTKALVYTKAPHIMQGLEEGGVRKPKKGKWIAIPTEFVPKARNKKYTPSNWPTSFPELYFVQDNKGNSYLVGQTIYKQTKSGKQVIRKSNSRNESQAETVIYFYLKKRTKHNKLINFYHAWHESKDKLKTYIKQELAKTER